MTHEIETGFGSGLRAQLSRKLGAEEAPEMQDVPVVPEQPAEILPLGDVLPLMPETLVDEPAEVAALRSELEGALTRERSLREALEHQVEAYERELASARELAVREAEVEQRVARAEATQAELEEQQLMVKIQRDQVEGERVELARARAELVAEEARVTELATHMELTVGDLEKMMIEASAVNLISLNKKWYETDSYKDVREIDILEDKKGEDPTRRIQKNDLMRLVTKGLNRNERLIIILYYYEELTMKEIGATLDLSESRVSQMHSSIVQRLQGQLLRRRPEFSSS